MPKIWLMLIFLQGSALVPVTQVSFTTKALCEAAREKVILLKRINAPKAVCVRIR